MSAGVKIYNKDNKLMISNTDVCFGLSQKLTASTGFRKSPAYMLGFYGKVEVTNCVTPLIVHELGSADNKVNMVGGNSTPDIITTTFLSTKKEAPIDFYVFDISSKAIKNGQPVFRLYKSDGELSFDSRIQNLEIVGEIYDGMPLDPNKQYGVLHRSRPAYQYIEIWEDRGSRVYLYETGKSQVAWRAIR